MVRNDSDSALPVSLRALRADETLSSTTEPAALRRRSRLLSHLESRGGTAPVSALVDALAAEADAPALERDRDRLRIRLVHVDLPRLEARGAVASDAGDVRLLEAPDWYRPTDG
ncbi:DUF7344 domain-containing protein [Halopiger aswanensis]|uniref:DUF7344 domain-containing protein n=1 Tax=Halopiger aswanensis TaxID=148449 RepID=A0A419WNP2_9EURY|nr:hypothetical protein [Halopiger aswanensis]RKD97069.1 hypothetical protein ATJ93_0050 [Halopiger aswanensis]